MKYNCLSLCCLFVVQEEATKLLKKEGQCAFLEIKKDYVSCF